MADRKLYDINAELEAAAASAAVRRQRGQRPDVPVPFGNLIQGPASYGPTVAPFISEFQVLGLPAANRCVNLLANGVASMTHFDGSIDAYQDDEITLVDPKPPICKRPNASIGAFAHWHQAVAAWAMRGNFLGIYADFDFNGYPRQVVQVPNDISYAVYEDGLAVFYIGGIRYNSWEVCHVPNFLIPGSPWGIGYVSQYRRALSQQLDQQHMAADVYHRGSIPTLAITTDRPRQDSTQAKQVQDDWIESQGGGQRKPAVLPEGWTVQKLSWSPEDLDFLGSREFSIAEAALMFNLDPSDLGAGFGSGGSQQTYANIDQRVIGRRTESIGPIARRFEDAWSDMLPGGQRARFYADAWMALDAKTRAEVHQINIETRVETVDEARKVDGKKALPKSEIPPGPFNPAETAKQMGKDDAAAGLTDTGTESSPGAVAPTTTGTP